MATDLAHEVGAQSTEGVESDKVGGDTGADSAEKEGVQSTGQDNSDDSILSGKDLPPELEEARKKLFQDYHDKTQKIAADKKNFEGKIKDLEYSHTLLNQVMEQDWFKAAYAAEKAKKTGLDATKELSDDEFETVKNDKRAFMELVRKQAEAIMESKYGNKLSGADRELRELRSEREKERMASKHEGFKQALESGALDEFLKANSNYETAYALHTLRNGGPKSDADSVDQRVREVLASRRAASVDKPGVTSAKGVRVIKGARNWQEAFDLAMKAHEKGETNLKFER